MRLPVRYLAASLLLMTQACRLGYDQLAFDVQNDDDDDGAPSASAGRGPSNVAGMGSDGGAQTSTTGGTGSTQGGAANATAGATTAGSTQGGTTATAGAGTAGSTQGGTTATAGAATAGSTQGGTTATAGAATGGAPAACAAASTVYEDWSETIGSNGSEWRVAFGDPRVDVANHRLVVTYDDVAERKIAYGGGYYVATQVTLTGGTVLTPYPYSNEKVWPSVRRSNDGLAIELGGTQYGMTQQWTSDDWPGFSGISITGTTQVVLLAYVKATAGAFAVKVIDGSSVYRSGWISGFTWADTNLGVLRYVGENNSRVYTGDAVYVGPLSGCQNLTDAAIQTLFDD